MTQTRDPLSLGGELLTLQEAADRLKVHYMTAYRWVRKGELPAFKAGGRLRVRASDLDRFVADREVDVALPSPQLRRTDWASHVTRLYALLIEGKSIDAGSHVRKVVSDGAPAGEVYVNLIAPSLHRIGEDWAAGRLSIAHEHRATEIASQIMARMSEFFRRRGPSRGTAVTMTPPGDQHVLGSAMVADFLRAGGYDVHHLGSNVPIEDLKLFLQVVPADVVCVSATSTEVSPDVFDGLVRAAQPTPIVVGGQAAAPAVMEAAGAVYVANLAELTVKLEALLVRA